MRPQIFTIRAIGQNRVYLITADMLLRFFDNRNPRDWTRPTPICVTEWVS